MTRSIGRTEPGPTTTPEGGGLSVGNKAWGIPTQWSLIAVYLGLSAMLVLVHAYKVNLAGAYTEKRYDRHQKIVSNTGLSPWAYRVAVPLAAEALSPAFQSLTNKPFRAVESSYLILRWFFITFALLLFHAYLRTWFEGPWVLAGVFLFAALHPASFFFYWFQPASALDLVLWLIAAVVSRRGRGGWWLVALVFVGAFNRETIVFVTVIHFALRFGREPTVALLARCAAIFAAWAVVFLGLRFVLGFHPADVPAATSFGQNFSSPMWWVYALCFFGALWLLPFRRWKEQPEELRRLLFFLVPYLILQLVFGRVREVRLLLPLAIVLIPMTLNVLRSELPGASNAEIMR
jgi:hypothetical protein